jgi:signal peptidase I
MTGFGPSGPHTLVKRVIGTPGQSVECCSPEGAVIVDGEPLDEAYVWNDFMFEPGVTDCTSVPTSQRCFDAVTVPKDSYLMLGDNRAGSADSAFLCRTADATEDCWRWATREGIVGKAVAILWPITRWAPL